MELDIYENEVRDIIDLPHKVVWYCPSCNHASVSFIKENELMECQPCSVCGKTEVEIDEKFIDIIRLLNTKGYKTSACCEGHLTKYDSRNACIPAYLVIDHMNDKQVMTNLYQSFIVNCRSTINHHLIVEKVNNKKYRQFAFYMTLFTSHSGEIYHEDSLLDFIEAQTRYFIDMQKFADSIPSLK